MLDFRCRRRPSLKPLLSQAVRNVAWIPSQAVYVAQGQLAGRPLIRLPLEPRVPRLGVPLRSRAAMAAADHAAVPAALPTGTQPGRTALALAPRAPLEQPQRCRRAAPRRRSHPGAVERAAGRNSGRSENRLAHAWRITGDPMSPPRRIAERRQCPPGASCRPTGRRLQLRSAIRLGQTPAVWPLGPPATQR